MKRWKKITLWITSIVIILVVGGLFAANYAVDKFLDSMVGVSVDDLLEDDDTLQQTSDPAEGNDAGNDQEDTDQNAASNDAVTSEDTDQEQSATDSSNNPNTSVSSNNNGNSTGGGQTGSSGSGSTSNSSSGSSGGYSAEISIDKAKEVEENITVSEKAKVVSTLMSSLSASDISTLQKLASGGLTVEEKKEARALLLEKLTEDQYNELIAIAAKHGLSQGKKYSEVKDQ